MLKKILKSKSIRKILSLLIVINLQELVETLKSLMI